MRSTSDTRIKTRTDFTFRFLTELRHLVDWQYHSGAAGRFKNNFRFLWHFIQKGWQSAPHTFDLPRDSGEWGKPMHRVSDAVRSTHGQDGAIMLDVQQGQMFNLNQVGSRILELLERGSTESEIVNLISREFNAAPELVASDVKEFLATLKACRLVEEQCKEHKSTGSI